MSCLIDVNRVVLVPEYDRLDGGLQRHPFHEVVYYLAGDYRAEIDGEEIPGGPGRYYYHPAGAAHRGFADGQVTLLLLQWREDHDGAGRPRHREDHDGRLLALLEWLIEEWILGRGVASPLAEQLLATVIAVLEAEPRTITDRPELPLRSLLGIIAQEFSRPLTVDELAHRVGYSPFHLIRACRRQLGATPGVLLRRARLQAARNLLAGGLPLAEIAGRVGYGSARALRRALKSQDLDPDRYAGPLGHGLIGPGWPGRA